MIILSSILINVIMSENILNKIVRNRLLFYFSSLCLFGFIHTNQEDIYIYILKLMDSYQIHFYR